MKLRPSIYRKSIMQMTGCSPEESAKIEILMRDAHGVLDGLDRYTFTNAARSAAGQLLEDAELSELLENE